MEQSSQSPASLLESAYEASLLFELHWERHKTVSHGELPVIYETVSIDVGYGIDLLVEDAVKRMARDSPPPHDSLCIARA